MHHYRPGPSRGFVPQRLELPVRGRPRGFALAQAWGRCYVAPVSVEARGLVDQPVDEDKAWVAALARGEQQALSKLYDRYSGLMMAVGVRILGDRREVEDLLHDVFLEVWRRAKTYDPDRGTVRAWLVIRMRSRALDRVRSRSRAKVVLSAEPESPERAAEGVDPSDAPDRRIVRQALLKLPEEQRQVLELGYFGGMSSSEIAVTLDIPLGTVKSRVARGLAGLRRGLIPEQGGGS